jgi:glycosyl transferase family 1
MFEQLKRSYLKRSAFGLVLDWDFHRSNRWASAYSSFLAEAIIAEFDPVIISSQQQYDFHRKRLSCILSFEPGWAAPHIRYDRRCESLKAVMYSDPHYQPEVRSKYFEENGFDFLLSLYRAPFFQHFKGFPEEKFVHFPWAVPDRFVSDFPIRVRSTEVAIFGGKASEAYDVRNWCRTQPGITGYDYSGVENKRLGNEEYYRWLESFDAIIAAGSSKPIYNLVTPKYFEIPASGALLVGQFCEDLEVLGFDASNSLIFSPSDFMDKVANYRRNPEAFLVTRERGRELIRSQHRLSDRIALLKGLFHGA